MNSINETVEHIFWLCNTSKSPVKRLASACSKVGWLARSANEPDLHYLESALNEQKHGTLLGELAKWHDGPDATVRASQLRAKASRHFEARDRDLAGFKRAIARATAG